jgi:osmoprotectant transport system substrate-binding protein
VAAPMAVNSTYTLMMHGNRARKLKLSTISDLAAYVKKNPRALIIGVNPEFWGRPDGFKNLMKFYGFRVPPQNIKLMATGITYTALKEGKIDLGMGFSTDGRIAAWGLSISRITRNFSRSIIQPRWCAGRYSISIPKSLPSSSP